MFQRFAARISYVGTAYCGWQQQSHEHPRGLRSIQEQFQAVLTRMAHERVIVSASGRTDSGVHALGQVIHFDLTRREWDPAILQKGMNSLLPPDIRVIRVAPVPHDFHSQFASIKKQYGYYFLQGPSELPHLRPYSYWIRRTLDVARMQEAAAHLVGEKDFAPFQAADGNRKTTVRKIFSARVREIPIGFPAPAGAGMPVDAAPDLLPAHRLVKVEVLGSGFLKQMVRGIAGTLVQVGDGRREPGSMEEILRTGQRELVGPTAAARGLWMEHVWYPEGVDI